MPISFNLIVSWNGNKCFWFKQCFVRQILIAINNAMEVNKKDSKI